MTKYRWLILLVVGVATAVVGRLVKFSGVEDIGIAAAIIGLMDVVF